MGHVTPEVSADSGEIPLTAKFHQNVQIELDVVFRNLNTSVNSEIFARFYFRETSHK